MSATPKADLLTARLDALAVTLQQKLIERHRRAAIDGSGEVPAVGEELDQLIAEEATLLSEQNTHELEGDRLVALSRLLPNINASLTESRR